MNRRRKLLAAVLVGAPLAAIAAACTFPEVNFATDASSEGDAGSDSQSEIDGTAATFPDGAPDSNATLPDANVSRPDGSGPVDPGKCALAAPCDCDNDGYKSDSCDGGFDASLKAGDCDDLDPLRHRDQDYQPYVWDAGGIQGDWNCNDQTERDPGTIDCAPVKVLGGVGYQCPTAEGFANKNLPCGFEYDIYKCPTNSALLSSDLNCAAVLAGKRGTVRCK